MSEYKRLGPEEFWRCYGDILEEVDDQVSMAVLLSLNASEYYRYAWKGRHTSWYLVVFRNGGTFRIVFDVLIPRRKMPKTKKIEIRMFCQENGVDVLLGSVTVRVPRRNWKAPRAKLRSIFEKCNERSSSMTPQSGVVIISRFKTISVRPEGCGG